MRIRAILCATLTATAALTLVPSAAHASKVDTGQFPVKSSAMRRATCAKAAYQLIQASQHSSTGRSTAFTRITGIRTIAKNVTTTGTMPSGASYNVTDKVRCSGTGTRRKFGTSKVWFALNITPDFVDMPLSQLQTATTPPPNAYSVTYQTVRKPAW